MRTPLETSFTDSLKYLWKILFVAVPAKLHSLKELTGEENVPRNANARMKKERHSVNIKMGNKTSNLDY